MFGTILCTKKRAEGESYVQFFVDENNYTDSASRQITKVDTLNGNVITTDWGFAEGRRQINLNVLLTYEQYNTLRSFNEDNLNTFVFCYRTDAWLVSVEKIQRTPFGANVRADITLSVSAKLLGDGEYLFASSSSSSVSISSSSRSSSSSSSSWSSTSIGF